MRQGQRILINLQNKNPIPTKNSTQAHWNPDATGLINVLNPTAPTGDWQWHAPYNGTVPVPFAGERGQSGGAPAGQHLGHSSARLSLCFAEQRCIGFRVGGLPPGARALGAPPGPTRLLPLPQRSSLVTLPALHLRATLNTALLQAPR